MTSRLDRRVGAIRLHIFFLPSLHSSTRRARVTISNARRRVPAEKSSPGTPPPLTRARVSPSRDMRVGLSRATTHVNASTSAPLGVTATARAVGGRVGAVDHRYHRAPRHHSTSSSQRAVVARAARGPGGNRHRDDDASDGERAGADEASLVPYTVRVAKPPRFEDLGVHRLPKNTACGETIEVERGWFIVHRVTTMYNLVRGKYEKDGRRLDVQRAERFFVNAALEAAYRADDAVGRG